MLAKTAVIRWHLINACIPWESKHELIFFEKVGTRLLRGGRSTVAKIAPCPPHFSKSLSSTNQKSDQQKSLNTFLKPWLHHTAKLLSA
jgi:hypothetical protein